MRKTLLLVVVVVLLLTVIAVANGNVEHIKIPHVIEVDFRDGKQMLCFPFYTPTRTKSIAFIAEKGAGGTSPNHWRNAGGDGHGGTS